MFYIVKGEEIVGKSGYVFPAHSSMMFIESELDVSLDEAIVDNGSINIKPIVEKSYIELRREAYPSILAQLDSIFHNGIDGWKAKIQIIKDRFPKPEVI
jgi:hypothetical protein